jgi:hypothetical protein
VKDLRSRLPLFSLTNYGAPVCIFGKSGGRNVSSVSADNRVDNICPLATGGENDYASIFARLLIG